MLRTLKQEIEAFLANGELESLSAKIDEYSLLQHDDPWIPTIRSTLDSRLKAKADEDVFAQARKLYSRCRFREVVDILDGYKASTTQEMMQLLQECQRMAALQAGAFSAMESSRTLGEYIAAWPRVQNYAIVLAKLNLRDAEAESKYGDFNNRKNNRIYAQAIKAVLATGAFQ